MQKLVNEELDIGFDDDMNLEFEREVRVGVKQEKKPETHTFTRTQKQNLTFCHMKSPETILVY
jgi:hypothetical protein